MAGQDQSIPQNEDPTGFRVTPLVPPTAGNPPAANANLPVVSAGAPSQSQDQNTQVSAPVAATDTSADTGAHLLADIFKAKKDTIDATAASMKANNAIDQNAAQQVNNLFDSSMAAFDNLKKIERWSATGVPGIIGIFDSDWNTDYQRLVLQSNQISAQQIGDRAAAQKNINKQVPELSKLAGDLATSAYTVFSDTRKLDQEDRKINLQSIETKIQLEQEGRLEEANAIDKLTLTQKHAALKDAKANKGPFAGMGGLLEKSINDETKAELSLAELRTSVAAGNDELSAKRLQRFTSYLPTSQLQPLIQEAMKQNKAVITLPTDKKGGIINIPLPVAQQALVDNQTRETGMRKQLATQAADDAQISQKINEVTASAAALSTADPRAGHELTIIGNQLKPVEQGGTLDYNDFNSIRQGSSALDASIARLKTIADDVAKTYKTPEAQQAVRNYGANGGIFTAEGGQAVVADTIGNFGAANSSRYKTAFDVLNREVASRIAQQSAGGRNFTTSSTSPQAIDNATILSILSQNQAKLKDSDIVSHVLSDPSVNQQVITQIQNTIRPQALISSIQSLATDKGASPIWAQLLHNPEHMSKDGAISTRVLMDYLETQSAGTAYKSNYGNALLQRMQKYGTVADNNAAQDPSYTIPDRALETRVFGARPHSAVVSSLYNELKVIGASSHKAMRERIQSDISGQTKRTAGVVPAPAGNVMNENDPQFPVPANTPVPSATGLPISDDQIRQMFTGGR